jgi:hypothetical protein
MRSGLHGHFIGFMLAFMGRWDGLPGALAAFWAQSEKHQTQRVWL